MAIRKQTARSIWEVTSGVGKAFPSCAENLTSDVAIVGGGIAGLTAAFLLSRAGAKVVLLEARQIGLGTTGRSTGNLYAMTDKHLSTLEQSYGIDVTKQVVLSRLAAIAFIEQTINAEGIACDFQRVPFFQFLESENAKKREFFDRECGSAARCGLSAEVLAQAPLPFATCAALRINEQAQFHPLLYARGLAGALSQSCQVFENSPVLEVDHARGRVTTKQGSVQAKHIVMATHSPKGFSPLQLMLAPIREFGLAADLKDQKMVPGIYWGADEPKHSVRSVSVSGKEYLVVIGEKHKTGQKLPSSDPLRSLESYASHRFHLGTERIGWAAQAYQGADRLPYMGRSRKRTYQLTGFSTDGLVFGTLGAMIVSDQILGKENPWADLYRPRRCRPLKSAASVAKEGMDVFCHYQKDLPRIGTKKLEDIKSGEGGIVERHGEKLAVYRNTDGGYECVSAVCTHMKCIVAFNAVEKTWDCPCHASRFETSGKVIEGPALKDLEARKL